MHAWTTTKFSQCFTQWAKAVHEFTKGEVVAIDGKTICNSGHGKNKAIHVVSAFVSQNKLCLGQKKVADKSNEITAIPELLDILDIKGCIVTIDAMGCQREIAQKILYKEADYILMVKDNQKELKEQVEKVFNIADIDSTCEQIDKGHGRIEQRKCDVVTDLRFLDVKDEWEGLKSIVRICSSRHCLKTGKTAQHTRYYISSLNAHAKNMNRNIRFHWAIENNLHWELDVIFNEDRSLKKKGNSPMNYNIILKYTQGLLNAFPDKKLSKPKKRVKAAHDDEYREKLLNL